MDERERRLAQNEALFREVNERVNDIADAERQPQHDLTGYVCECANPDCTFVLQLSGDEYETVRADAAQFVVLPDHYTPEIESLVSRHERYWIVKKSGEAGDYAERLDPRSR
jgi:hypothetical protein